MLFVGGCQCPIRYDSIAAERCAELSMTRPPGSLFATATAAAVALSSSANRRGAIEDWYRGAARGQATYVQCPASTKLYVARLSFGTLHRLIGLTTSTTLIRHDHHTIHFVARNSAICCRSSTQTDRRLGLFAWAPWRRSTSDAITSSNWSLEVRQRIRRRQYSVNRSLMKLFCTNNSSTVEECIYYFNIVLPSELLGKRTEKFLRKLNATWLTVTVLYSKLFILFYLFSY